MKIACIGNITYDVTVIGQNFIKEGGKSSFSNATFTVGGPASNAASVISKFNQDNKSIIDFYGQIGDDTNGKFVYKQLVEENINMKHINIKSNFLTPFSFIIANKSNSTRTICSLRSPDDFNKPNIESIDYDKNYDYILTDGKYVDNTIELIKRNPQAVTIIDAGRVNDGVLKLCNIVDYVVCSDEFASNLTGIEMGTEENDFIVYNKLKRMFKNTKGITITVGSRGYICEHGEQIVLNPAFVLDKPAIDTNGAGDIFHGAFTHALANGYSYHDSLKFANITAALSTTKVGGRKSCPELSEVEKHFNTGLDLGGPTKILKQ